MPRNPRDRIPKEKMCEHIFPEDHPTRPGEQCGAVKKRNSRFCYYHQPEKEKLLEQLEEAREARVHPPNTKHGFYAEKRECSSCTLKNACEYVEEGKKECDFNLNNNVDLSSLSNIQKYAEEIVSSEIQTYRLLDMIVRLNPENADLVNLKRMSSKTIMSVLKDFSGIKEVYEKKNTSTSWKDILTQ